MQARTIYRKLSRLNQLFGDQLMLKGRLIIRMPVASLFIREKHMNRLATRFVGKPGSATKMLEEDVVMRALRSLLTSTNFVVLVVDATLLGGRYRQIAWREAQTNAQLVPISNFNYHLNRMVQFAGLGR